MMRGGALIVCLVVLAGACSSGESGDTTTTSTVTTTQATTTTAAPTTSQAPETTTTEAPTTTASAGAVVDPTPIIAELQPYNEQGAELFPGGSVQAHWYQWNGLYVILYRGFDAADGSPICAGNSIQESSGFTHISNSPHGGTAEEICNGVPKLAEEPSGAYSCGSLLYYLTEIPTETAGNLFGTLEIVEDNASTVYGQTSAVTASIDATPEFEPGLTAYDLPSSTVDDLGAVSCG
jgi:hypothetical protein